MKNSYCIGAQGNSLRTSSYPLVNGLHCFGSEYRVTSCPHVSMNTGGSEFSYVWTVKCSIGMFASISPMYLTFNKQSNL